MTTQTHKSYGILQISRTRGGGSRRMFGTNLDRVPTRISLKLLRGSQEHDLGSNWYGPASLKPLIEVELTPHQFSEAITNIGGADGVPCTVRYLEDEQVDEPPPIDNEYRTVLKDIEDRTGRLGQDFHEIVDEIEALLRDAKVSRVKMTRILGKVRAAGRFLSDSGPHLMTMFRESIHKTVVEAKAEVDAFVTKVAMDKAFGQKPTLILDTGDDDE